MVLAGGRGVNESVHHHFGGVCFLSLFSKFLKYFGDFFRFSQNFTQFIFNSFIKNFRIPQFVFVSWFYTILIIFFTLKFFQYFLVSIQYFCLQTLVFYGNPLSMAFVLFFANNNSVNIFFSYSLKSMVLGKMYFVLFIQFIRWSEIS